MRVPHLASYLLLLIPFVCSLAQKPEEKTMSELLADLPAVARANHLELPLYGAKIDEAYKRNPGSLEAAVPVLERNLTNKEPWVQFESAVLVQSLAMESNDAKFVLRFSDQLANLIVSGGDEYTRGAAIGAVSLLIDSAPDNIVQALLTTLNDRTIPDRVLVGTISSLLLTRPTDTRVEDSVLSAVEDPVRSKEQRQQIFSAIGQGEGLTGQPIVDYIVSVANTSNDTGFRDSAIFAAERVGLRALDRIGSRLSLVANDPNESATSRAIAAHALKMQAHSVR